MASTNIDKKMHEERIQELRDSLALYSSNPALQGNVEALQQKIDELAAHVGDNSAFAKGYVAAFRGMQDIKEKNKETPQETAQVVPDQEGTGAELDDDVETDIELEEDLEEDLEEELEADIEQDVVEPEPVVAQQEAVPSFLQGQRLNRNNTDPQQPDLSQDVKVMATRVVAGKTVPTQNNSFDLNNDFKKQYNDQLKQRHIRGQARTFWNYAAMVGVGIGIAALTASGVGQVIYIAAAWGGILDMAARQLKYDSNKKLIGRVEKKAPKTKYRPGDPVSANWPARKEWEKNKHKYGGDDSDLPPITNAEKLQEYADRQNKRNADALYGAGSEASQLAQSAARQQGAEPIKSYSERQAERSIDWANLKMMQKKGVEDFKAAKIAYDADVKAMGDNPNDPQTPAGKDLAQKLNDQGAWLNEMTEGMSDKGGAKFDAYLVKKEARDLAEKQAKELAKAQALAEAGPDLTNAQVNRTQMTGTIEGERIPEQVAIYGDSLRQSIADVQKGYNKKLGNWKKGLSIVGWVGTGALAAFVGIPSILEWATSPSGAPAEHLSEGASHLKDMVYGFAPFIGSAIAMACTKFVAGRITRPRDNSLDALSRQVSLVEHGQAPDFRKEEVKMTFRDMLPQICRPSEIKEDTYPALNHKKYPNPA